MVTRILAAVLILASAVTCAKDNTITRGAETTAQWHQNAVNAVPLGTPRESAAAIMRRNGFSCTFGEDIMAHLWCDKRSGSQPVSRRWQAIIVLDSNRVSHIDASTGLIGP